MALGTVFSVVLGLSLKDGNVWVWLTAEVEVRYVFNAKMGSSWWMEVASMLQEIMSITMKREHAKVVKMVIVYRI